jgi:thioredoxin-dependent peroxiredoxin
VLRKLLARFHVQGHGTMLNVGDKAPDFEAKDQSGRVVRLRDFAGRRVVLWFYPKADTPG